MQILMILHDNPMTLTTWVEKLYSDFLQLHFISRFHYPFFVMSMLLNFYSTDAVKSPKRMLTSAKH